MPKVTALLSYGQSNESNPLYTHKFDTHTTTLNTQFTPYTIHSTHNSLHTQFTPHTLPLHTQFTAHTLPLHTHYKSIHIIIYTEIFSQFHPRYQQPFLTTSTGLPMLPGENCYATRWSYSISIQLSQLQGYCSSRADFICIYKHPIVHQCNYCIVIIIDINSNSLKCLKCCI